MVRVVVQERQRLLREGLALVLGAEDTICVIGTAADDVALLERTRSDTPDTVVIELGDTPWCTRSLIGKLRDQTGVDVVGMYDSLSWRAAKEAYDAGATMLVDRDRGVGSVIAAVSGRALPESLPQPVTATVADIRILTLRELEVLDLVGRGNTSREISELLGISRKTVENHKQRTFQKLGVQNQAHAVSVALRRGLLRSNAS